MSEYVSIERAFTCMCMRDLIYFVKDFKNERRDEENVRRFPRMILPILQPTYAHSHVSPYNLIYKSINEWRRIEEFEICD